MRSTPSARWWLPLAAAAVAALPLSAAQAATPSADLYVNAQAPRHNYGAERTLVVSRRPARQAFVRFDVGAPPPPGRRVVLYLYPLRSSRTGLMMRHAADAPWNERRITLATAPGTGPRVVRSGRLRARHWKAIDITHLVNGSGIVAVALATTGRERIELASRESGRRAPRLALQSASAAIAPVPPADAPVPSGAGPAGGARPSGGPASSPSPAPAPAPAPGPTPTAAQPCGVTTSAPAYKHVVWIVMENKAASQIVGSASAPYINWLAARCGSATNFYGETHPSLPNYIAMTSGGTQGVTDDAAPSAHPLAAQSIFSQLGGDWRSLQESMPSACAKTTSGMYAVKHNPAAYYTNLAASCPQQDVALVDPPDISARFTFVTPNMCSDMHDCSINAGDTWLATWMPKFLGSSEYRSGDTAIFLTFDEDDKSGNNHVATLVVSPSTPAGMMSADRFDHYAMLRTTQEILGLAPLGAAATAPSMRQAFHL